MADSAKMHGMTPADSPHYEWAGRLADKVARQTGVELHAHVVARVAALLSREPLHYVDVDAEETPGGLNGRLCVWTERHLAVVTLRGVLVPGAGNNIDEHGAVAVTIVPRSGLRHIEIPAHPGHNQAWDSAPREDRWSWPLDAQLLLTYEGLDDVLAVPAGAPDEGFSELVLGLVEDQAR
jgi:hypothetical protein